MPRQGRIDFPGALHHIMVRGIERRDIFKTDNDKHDFLNRLGKVLLDTQTPCYAYALMSNHVHLLLQTGTTSISRVMQSLLTGYAVSYNLRHARAGKLYQNRFKSVLCEKEEYLLKLIQYIHLNPLRVGMIKSLKALDTSPLTGHSILMGKTKKIHLSPHEEKEPIPVNWLDTEEVLSNFSRTKKKARAEYRKYIQQGIGEQEEDLSGGGLVRSLGGVWEAMRLTKKKGPKEAADERILGTGEFVEEALRYAGEEESRASKLKRQGWNKKSVRKKVCEILLIKQKSLYNRGQQDHVSRARALYSKWLADELGMRKSDIAEELGVSRAAMGRLVKRGRSVEKELGVSLLET